MDITNSNKWYGILYSEQEIDELMEPVIQKYSQTTKSYPKEIIAMDISEAIGIPLYVATAYIDISFTLYANDLYSTLINVKALMKAKPHYSVYDSLRAYGIEETAENARKHVRGEV